MWKKSNWLEISILFILVFILILLIGNAFFIRPMVDDYSFAAWAIKNSFWDLQYYLHNNENGRYSVLFLLTLLPKYFTLEYLVPIYIISSLLFFVTSVYILSKIVFPNNVFFYFGISLIVFLNTLPAISEVIYWFTGNLTHFFPLALFLFLFSLMLSLLRSYKTYKFILAIILIPILNGFNELIVLSVFFGLFFLVVYSYQNKPELLKVFILLLIINIIFGAFELFSQSNINRMEATQSVNRANVSFTLYGSAILTFRYLIAFFSKPELIIIFLALVIKPLKIRTIKYLNPFLLGLASVFVIYSLFTPGVYSMVGTYPRVVNTIYFVFLILYIYNILYFLNYYEIAALAINKKLQFFIPFIFIFSLFFENNNSAKVMSDLYRGRSLSFRNELMKRERILKSNNKTIQLEVIKKVPKSWGHFYLKQKEDSWTNIGYRLYFNKKNIKYNVADSLHVVY